MAKVHRAYRHSWWRTSKEITTRDCQAMSNFYGMGISLETLAQHFCCSVARVSDEIGQRSWLVSRKKASDLGTGLTWWESDHSDPLYLVKLYYPHSLPEQATAETNAKEKRDEMTYQEYLDTVDWAEAFTQYGDRAPDVVMEKAREIASRDNLDLIFAGQ